MKEKVSGCFFSKHSVSSKDGQLTAGNRYY